MSFTDQINFLQFFKIGDASKCRTHKRLGPGVWHSQNEKVFHTNFSHGLVSSKLEEKWMTHFFLLLFPIFIICYYEPGPNLNTLCVQYLDTFPLSKSHKKFV